MPTRSRVLKASTFVAVCALGVAVAVAATALALGRDADASADARPSAAASAARERITLSIIGEGYADDAAVLVSDDYWATRVAVGLKANVTLRVGSDTSTTSALGPVDLEAEATKTARESDVVVLMVAAQTPLNTPAATDAAITRAFSIARERSPRAALVLVGPLVPEDAAASELRSALAAAAKIVSGRFVDPMTQQWLTAAERDAFLAGAPSPSGQRTFARHIEQVVEHASAAH